MIHDEDTMEDTENLLPILFYTSRLTLPNSRKTSQLWSWKFNSSEIAIFLNHDNRYIDVLERLSTRNSGAAKKISKGNSPIRFIGHKLADLFVI